MTGAHAIQRGRIARHLKRTSLHFSSAQFVIIAKVNPTHFYFNRLKSSIGPKYFEFYFTRFGCDCVVSLVRSFVLCAFCMLHKCGLVLLQSVSIKAVDFYLV